MLTFTAYDQFLRVRVTGIDHKNPDGSSRGKTVQKFGRDGLPFLKREPENPVDKKAIAVYLEFLLKGKSTQVQIGYLPKEVARKLSPMIDKGARIDVYRSFVFDHTSDDSEKEYRMDLLLTVPDQAGLFDIFKTPSRFNPKLVGTAETQEFLKRCQPGQTVFLCAEDAGQIIAYAEFEEGALLWKKVARKCLGRLSDETAGYVEPHLSNGDQVTAAVKEVFSYRIKPGLGIEIEINIDPKPGG